MLNKVWFALLLIGILYGAGKGAFNSLTGRAAGPAARVADRPQAEDVLEEIEAPPGFTEVGRQITGAAIESAQDSVTICLGLIGIMALWLGLLNVARDAGLVDALARLLRPVLRWLFPDVPDGHPAQGAMLMNISANMLGIDNAATPMGLKAMKELQTLNPTQDTATDSMALFLAINTSSVTIIPFTIIGYRVTSGSQHPESPILGMLVVTTISTIVAVLVARYLARRPKYAMPITVTTDTRIDDNDHLDKVP